MTAASSTDPAHTSWVGRRAELRVGAVAHGGHCVARLDGRVVFVRHALPGELVTVLVTEDGGGSFCRADAVEVTEPSPDRVEPPCRYAHPGGCGGCDFQHVDPAAQRRLKADVVIEQFRRLAQLEVAVDVAPLTPEALGWRRRVRYTVARTGRLGLHEHRSGRLVEVEECLLGVPGIAEPPADAGWRPGDEVQASQDDRGRVAVLVSTPRAPARGRRRRQPGLQRVRSGPAELRYQVGQRWFRVRAAGFWQAHVQAAEVLNRRMLDDAAVAAGETVLDLYCGAGLFTAFLAESAGVTGRVVGIEAEPGAAADANATLAEVNWAEVRRATVSAELLEQLDTELGGVDVIVLDPPRTGAGQAIMAAVAATARRRIVYVACDPAALARDTAVAVAAGWRLESLQGYDAFPMTHHVECVASFCRA